MLQVTKIKYLVVVRFQKQHNTMNPAFVLPPIFQLLPRNDVFIQIDLFLTLITIALKIIVLLLLFYRIFFSMFLIFFVFIVNFSLPRNQKRNTPTLSKMKTAVLLPKLQVAAVIVVVTALLLNSFMKSLLFAGSEIF